MLTKILNAAIKRPYRRDRAVRGYAFGKESLARHGYDFTLDMWEGHRDPEDWFDKGVEMALCEHRAMAEGGTAQIIVDGKVIGTCNSYGEWTIE